MADIIKIVLPSETETETPVAKSSTDMGSGSGGTGSGDGALSARDVVRGAKKLMAYTGIKQIADSYISFEVSNVNLKTGASEFQQRLQFVYNEGSQAASSVGAVAMGFIMGGPAGAGIAAAGVGLSYLMKFIGWQQNSVRLDLEQNLENVSIGMANIRAGTAGRRSPNQ